MIYFVQSVVQLHLGFVRDVETCFSDYLGTEVAFFNFKPCGFSYLRVLLVLGVIGWTIDQHSGSDSCRSYCDDWFPLTLEDGDEGVVEERLAVPPGPSRKNSRGWLTSLIEAMIATYPPDLEMLCLNFLKQETKHCLKIYILIIRLNFS